MTLREQLIIKATRGCKHFTGIQNESCAAGVNIRQLVGGEDLGWALRIPCIQINRNHSAGSLPDKDIPKVKCSKFCTLTRAEAEKQADEDIDIHESTMKALHLAHEDARNNGFGEGHAGQGTIKCPKCADGFIHYRVAAYNGHMHASCSTINCVSWME